MPAFASAPSPLAVTLRIAARDLRAGLRGFGIFLACLALGVGAVASGILSRRLARLTLGLQPSELAGLVQDQAAVLSGVGEGVLGLGPDGRVTVCNPRAAALLGLVDPVGRTLDDLGVAPVLREAVARARAGTAAPGAGSAAAPAPRPGARSAPLSPGAPGRGGVRVTGQGRTRRSRLARPGRCRRRPRSRPGRTAG